MTEAMTETEAEWLEIGRIVAPQGLRGEVRIRPDSDFPERFVQPGQRWMLRPNAAEPEAVTLERGRELSGKGLYVIKLQGVNDRNQAEALRGAMLLVPSCDRIPLAENEFHVSDLIGLEVFDQATQTAIGTVTGVIPAGNDLLEVQRHSSASSAIAPAPLSEHSSEYLSEGSRIEQSDAPQPDLQSSDSPSHHSQNQGSPRQTKRQTKGRRPRSSTSTPAPWLIPFVTEIVPVVDLEQGRIEVNPPAGLLDI